LASSSRIVYRLFIAFTIVAFLSLNGIAANENDPADVNAPAVADAPPSIQTSELAKSNSAAASGSPMIEAPVPESGAPEAAPKEEVPGAVAPAQTDNVVETAVSEAPAKEESSLLQPGNITVNFKSADIRTVLSYISEVAGVDVVAAPDVTGVIDLRLTDKPWKVALDIIVRNYGFAYERNGDIIRVVTLDKLKQEEALTQAFSLNYGNAEEIVSAIEDMVGERGNVLFDERTNMVLVTDIPTNVYKIGEVIQKLDRETQQVLVEARILETVLSDDERMGIDWNIKIAASGAKRPITFPFDYFDADNKYLKKFSPLDQTNTDSTTTGTGGVTGSTTVAAFPSNMNGSVAFPFVDIALDQFKNSFTFGTLDFSQFRAVMEMIKKRADTNVVSNPRVTTLNNNPAYIIVGETINMPKYERNSTTGKMEVSGYDAKDLGIKLKVTPHINEKGEIAVDIAPEISDFLRYDTLDASSGIVAPVFSSRQANTKVMISDQDTIFIGGMIKENMIDVKKPIPFVGDLLGDVPLVGLLVSKKEKVKQKTELIFFITVKLMKPGADLSDLPSVDKTYKPNYDYNQKEWQKTVKKRKIK
jgi:Type II secretory pathway, component PulD